MFANQHQQCAIERDAAPPARSLAGHLPEFKRDPLGFLTHCTRTYGTVVPLRMLHIRAFLLLDADDIERVLVTEHREFIKPAWLRTRLVRRMLGDGLITSEGERWRSQRQACQHAFQRRCMDSYGDTISSLAARMLATWETGQTRDLQTDLAHLTLEIVAGTLLDVDAPGWTVEAGEAMNTLMDRFTAGRSLFGMIPWPPGSREIRATQKLDRVSDLLIRQHDENPLTGRGDDLISWMRKPVSEMGGGMSEHLLREQVKTFLTAGHESSALALTWAFVLLAEHPAVRAALTEELRSALNGRSPACRDQPRLPYTLAVVQETLRLYPPLWMTGRESTRACDIGGTHVPAGGLIMTSQWAVQRLLRYFPQPDEFRPERWINGETADLPRHAYFPFGGGPRICIAHSFALMESVLILAAIAQRFDLELLPGPEIRPTAAMTLRPSRQVIVRLHKSGVTAPLPA